MTLKYLCSLFIILGVMLMWFDVVLERWPDSLANQYFHGFIGGAGLAFCLVGGIFIGF